MKTIRTILSVMAVIAAAACSKVQESDIVSPADQGIVYPPVTFTASMGAASKTAIAEDKSVSWVAGDVLTVFDSKGNSESFTVEEDCEKFSFTSTGKIGVAPYYAVAGYGDGSLSFSKEDKAIVVSRPSYVLDGSFGDADMIASSSESNSFTFHHVFAILKMSVASADITSLKFVSDGIAPSGDTRIGFDEDGNLDVTYPTTGNEVVIDGISGAGTYYMGVNPGEYDGFTIFVTYKDKKMKIVSETGFTASTSKMVNFGTLDGGTPASTTWELVTDASTLSAGDQVIIAASGYDFAMSTTQNTGSTPYRGRASIVKSSDKSTLDEEPSSEVQVFTLVKGTADNSFAFSTGNGYIRAASSSKNSLNTSSTLDANSSWTISIKDGVASVIAQGTYTRNLLKYNDQNTRFSCYNANSTNVYDVAIYRKSSTEASGPQMTEISAFLDQTQWGVYEYIGSTDTVTPKYIYTEGTDQWAKATSGNVSFRIQNLSKGKMASTSFSTGSISAGQTYSATCILYGVDGISNGTFTKSLVVKKSEQNLVWLLEENGTFGMIIPSK